MASYFHSWMCPFFKIERGSSFLLGVQFLHAESVVLTKCVIKSLRFQAQAYDIVLYYTICWCMLQREKCEGPFKPGDWNSFTGVATLTSQTSCTLSAASARRCTNKNTLCRWCVTAEYCFWRALCMKHGHETS